MKRILGAALLALFVAAQPLPAAAADFSAAPAAQAPKYSADQVIAFSKKLEKELAARGARVAIISRAGRPAEEMPPGMHYTHAGFAVYSDITTTDGRHLRGYATFNDYQGEEEPDTSSLVQDYPVDFYAAVMSLEAGVIIPSPELQQRLLDFIGTPGYRALHQRAYSAIANPYTLGKQNCTEFVLDVIQAAIYRTTDVRAIKANTRAYFEAQPVHVGQFKLLLGAMFSREIALSDQPQMPPVTATFETIARYLQKYDPQTQVFTVLPD